MMKRLAVAAATILLSVGLSFAAAKTAKKQAKAAGEKTYVGVVSDTHCGAKGHMGASAECIKKCVEKGEKYALVYHGKVYVLDPQDMAAQHPGQKVRVKGTISGNTISASEVTELRAP